MLASLSASHLPPPDAIREAARAVASRPYFDLGERPPRDLSPPFWLEVLRWISEPFRWLFESLEGLPDFLRWLIVILSIALCVALIGHILYLLVSAVRGPIGRSATTYSSSVRATDPADLEKQAEQAGARADYIGAIRFLFRAALRRIELAEKRNFQPGFTNRELMRRYASSPLGEPIRRMAEVIELKWYGNSPCEQADYDACRDEHVRIRHQTERPKIPVGA